MSAFWTGEPLARITRPSNATPRHWRRRDDASFGAIVVTFTIGIVCGALIVVAAEVALGYAGIPLVTHRAEAVTPAAPAPSVTTGESSGASHGGGR